MAALKITSKIKTYVNMARIPLDMAAELVADLDADDEGTDDLAAAGMHYASALLGSLVSGRSFPPVPQELIDASGTTKD